MRSITNILTKTVILTTMGSLGLFWSGQQAVELGLADQLGNLDYVAREVVKAEELIDYTRRENVAERLIRRFGASIGEGAIRALRNLPLVH